MAFAKIGPLEGFPQGKPAAVKDRCQKLVTGYSSLHDIAQPAINIGLINIGLINIGLSLTNQPVYPKLPVVVNAPPAQPLFCTVRTFSIFGTGMSTTYTTCH
jgi:hypothetical protein